MSEQVDVMPSQSQIQEFMRPVKKEGKRLLGDTETPFSYFTIPLEGKSLTLGSHLKGKDPIVGVLFNNNIVAWTNSPARHEDIVNAEGGQKNAIFQGVPQETGLQNITLVVTRVEDILKTYDFLARSRTPPTATLQVSFSPHFTYARPVYEGKFGSFGIPNKTDLSRTDLRQTPIYESGDRAITYHLGTGRIASAWAHGSAYKKLGIKYGRDLSFDGLRMKDGKKEVIYFPISDSSIVKKVASALIQAGEPAETVLRFNIENLVNGIKELRLRDLVEQVKEN